jgi:hypothetical protein
MLWRAEDLYGIKLRGPDGTIGHVRDLLFDDTTWTIRYLVAEEVAWPFPHTFVLAPYTVTGIKWQERTCLVALSRRQVENDPRLRLAESITSQPPVALRYPARGGLANNAGASFRASHSAEPRESSPLKSARNLGTFTVHTKDGRTGWVTDLLIQKEDWIIGDLLVYVRTPGLYRRTMVAPHLVERIDWGQSRIYLSHSPAGLEAAVRSALPATKPMARRRRAS